MSNTDPFAARQNPYASTAVPAAFADESARAGFLRRTYMHLAGAVLALIALETVIFTMVPDQTMQNLVLRMGGMGWLLVLGAYMGVSWLARSWAAGSASKGMQYAGLGLYVCLLYTSPSPRDATLSRMPSSA